MQRIAAVLAVLLVSFIAPIVVPAAEAGTAEGRATARSHDSECRKRKSKKQHSDDKPKKKEKEPKKPYGFEL
jgi:hypothetical protein